METWFELGIETEHGTMTIDSCDTFIEAIELLDKCDDETAFIDEWKNGNGVNEQLENCLFKYSKCYIHSDGDIFGITQVLDDPQRKVLTFVYDLTDENTFTAINFYRITNNFQGYKLEGMEEGLNPITDGEKITLVDNMGDRVDLNI